MHTPLIASTRELFPADWLPITAIRGKSMSACALKGSDVKIIAMTIGCFELTPILEAPLLV